MTQNTRGGVHTHVGVHTRVCVHLYTYVGAPPRCWGGGCREGMRWCRGMGGAHTRVGV